MNWYIYWYFTIKYLFLGLLGYGRAGNYIGSLFFYLPFIALIMALIAPLSFVNDNKILIYLSCSILFIFINEIVFWYNPQIEMFARFKTKSSFHKTKRII